MVRRVCIALVSVAACAATSIGTARASSAGVAITGGGLTMSNPSVTVVSRDPTELDLRTTVTDARGTGSGWALSLAVTPDIPANGSLIVTGADAACEPGSSCTLSVNTVAYPLAASLTGTRARVFKASPSSGLGVQSIDLHVLVPAAVQSKLSLALSLSTLALYGATGPDSPRCSIPDLVKAGTCPSAP